MRTEIINTKFISNSEKKELYRLFEQFYVNTCYERFLSDFAQKQWLIRMSNKNEIAGFSTQELMTLDLGENKINFLFSGDTIVNPKYWRNTNLTGAFGHLFFKILNESDCPLYWFLISKGFRTYRLLPGFFNTFFPSFDNTNIQLKPLLDTVAIAKFGEQYNPNNQLITYKESREKSSEILTEISEQRKQNPHITFFLEKNPGYDQGIELACLAELSENCLNRFGQRVMRSTKIDWKL